MGTDSFKCLKAPEMFSFQFIIESVTIFAGENQNIDPFSRYELVEVPNILEDETNIAQPKEQGNESHPAKEIAKDGIKVKEKNKTKMEKKGNVKKKGKGKNAIPIDFVPTEKPEMVTKRKHIFLPPLRIDLRYFFNQTVPVDQIDLPDISEETKEVEKRNDTDLINYLAFDKGKNKKRDKKGKREKRGNKGKKREKRGKKGKQQKGKKIKPKEAKPQLIQEPSIEWVSDDNYSPEELSWRLLSEESFKKGLNITFPATREQMILWLQRGTIKTSIYRWKGYGENIPIGIANLTFDPSPFIQMIVKRAQKLDLSTVSCRAEDIADILDPQGEKIGEISAFFFLICNGGIVISDFLISEKGVFDFLSEETDKKKVTCGSCGKFGSNYGYEVLNDETIAIVPNSVVFDNSPFLTTDKYKEYTGALFKILSSPNPVSQLGQYVDKVVATGISPDDIII